ncbi:MAG: 2-amino-4-hydroxy-6-hydroxymethyldihydropteridine diphosphokinase [Marinilabiliales bacterium]|nr:2-amino-4-hydroxy-6-hydroxymethyldihydropteridine diphosphokinase [Marinilabiliales bacterium]
MTFCSGRSVSFPLPGLEVPHPKLSDRRFVLEPLLRGSSRGGASCHRTDSYGDACRCAKTGLT